MSEQPMYVFRFEMDQADRMRKSLRVSEVSVSEIAEHVGVHRNSVSAWLNGRGKPSDTQLAKWALRTGAPIEWLKTGHFKSETPPGGPQGGKARPTGFEPTTFCSVVSLDDFRTVAA